MFDYLNRESLQYLIKKLVGKMKDIINTTSSVLEGSYAGGLVINSIKGKTEQKQYSGKNLLKYPYFETTKTVNGITFTDLGDGRIKANGTATARAGFNLHGRTPNEINDFSLPNGNYIFSGCPSGGGTSTYRINFGVTQNGVYKELGSDHGNGITFTANGDDFSEDSVNMGIAIDIMAGQTIDLIFEPMIRLASITDDTYEPYVGGIPAPSPNYPQEIEVVGASGSIVVKSVGKNLIPYPYYDGKYTSNKVVSGDVEFELREDGTCIANGTSTASGASAVIVIWDKLFKAGTYSLSGCPSGGDNGTTYRLRLGKDGSTNTAIAFDTGKGVIFTLAEDTKINLLAQVFGGYTANNLVFKPMIRLADIGDDTYEQYKESKIIINTPTGLAGIPVDSDGNYTDEDGQQWICDEIVKYADGSGKRIQRIYRHKVEACSVYNSPRAFTNLPYEYPMKMYVDATTIYSMCNRFKTVVHTGLVSTNDNTCGGQGTNFAFRSDTLGLTSLEEWTAWFKANETIIYYVLEEPIISMLSAEEVIALLSLKSFDTVTHISTDSEVQPAIDLECGTSKVGGYTLDALNTAKRSEIKENTNAERLTALEALTTEVTTEAEES